MCAVSYDDSRLRRLYAGLEPKNRARVFKGAFRRVGNHVRKVAKGNLLGAGINNAEKVSAGIRVVVFKREAGFRVTTASRKANRNGKGERGMHLNRRNLKKPVLAWAEAGTARRKSRRRIRFRAKNGRWYTSSRDRGRMPRYGFMARTRLQVRDSATDMVHGEIIKKVEQIAKKYGCK